MTFKPDTLALTALLGLLTALGPISTDMYLPSLPSLTVTRLVHAAPLWGDGRMRARPQNADSDRLHAPLVALPLGAPP